MSDMAKRLAEGLAYAASCGPDLRFDPPLDSPEYVERLKNLNSNQPSPPRAEWPVNVAEIVERHREIAAVCLLSAAKHAKIAMKLAEG